MMAKKFKKVMSLLMVFVLCFGMLNLSVVAAEGFTPAEPDSTIQIEGEDLPLYHVHNSDATVDDPVVANRDRNPEVYASKTIYPTADENYFEIELMVETSEKITEIKTGTDTAVSLVIDLSGSMDDSAGGSCKHCGEEKENAERTVTGMFGRTYVEKYHECIEGESYQQATKLDAAVAAAKAFVDEYKNAGGETTGARWMSLSTFAYSSTTTTISLGGEDWADVSTTAGYDAMMTALNSFGSKDGNGGTDVGAALAEASGLLEDETVVDIEHKYVVLLGDGAPDSSKGFHGAPSGNYDRYSNYRDTGDANYSHAEKWARKLRTTQGAQIFSVYVETNGTTNSTGYQWFNTFSNRTVLATDAVELVETFEDYVAIISFGIEAWQVTDPMGANIQFVDKVSGQNNYNVIGNTLTWNLINDIPEIYDADGNEVDATDMVEDEAYTFIYTFKYGIRLNNNANGFAEETYYTTNGRTYLQYYLLDEDGDPIDLEGNLINSLLELNFVVPAVRGFLGELEFYKESPDGEPLSGAQFSLAHDGRACAICDGVSVGTLTATSDEDGLVSFAGIPSGHSYTLTETKAPEGYELSQAAHKVIVSYDEVTIDGVADDGSFVFINEPLPAYGPLTIVKEFAGDEVEAPAGLIFQVTGPDGYSASIPYADFVDGSYTIDSLIEGEYTVTESGAEVVGYVLSASSEIETAEIVDETGAEVSFINTYTRIPDPGFLTITKEFVDLPEEFYPASLSFTVAGPEGYEGETSITLNAENDWSYTIDNAPIGDYTVTEVGGGVDGYELISTTYNGKAAGNVTVAENAESIVAVVNTYDEIEKFGALTITKSFGADSVLDADNWPEDGKLTFVIASDAGEYSLTLPTASGEWTDGFAQLPVGTYTITETDNIDGYSFSKHFLVNGNAVTSFEITDKGLVELEVVNNYTKDIVYGTLTITKEFAGESVEIPANLTFVVTDASGDEVASVNYADFVNGSYTVDALPVGDYTVTESGATVTGYDLTATVENDGLVNVTENGGSVAFVNSYAETQKYGDLTITKSFSGVDALPAALTFLVKDSSDNEIASIAYADFVGGSYTLADLPVGDYTVTESGADVIGYTLTATAEDNGLVTVVEAGSAIAFENVYSRNTSTVPGSASITIEKIDENGDLITKSATFGLFKGDKRVATARTANGIATFTFGNTGIAAGEYTLKEVTAPRGYLRTEETWPVVVTSSSAVSETAAATVTTWTWDASVNGAASIQITNVKDEARIEFDKSASGVSFSAGTAYEYTLKVTNTGTQPAAEVTVVDMLPDEVIYTNGVISEEIKYDSEKHNLTWLVGELAVGETKSLTFEVTLMRNVPAGTVVTNEAYATWDEDPTNFEKDIVDITADEPETGNLTITKTFSGIDALSDDVAFAVAGPNGYTASITYGMFANGAYTLSGLEPGSYTVTESGADVNGYTLAVTANGAESDTATVDVVVRQIATVAFVNTYAAIPAPPAPTPEPAIPDVPPYIPPVEDEEPIEIEDPEVPLADEPGEDLEELLDEEVPLADVPKTGDPLLALLAVLGASGAGLTGLSLRGKRKEEDEN